MEQHQSCVACMRLRLLTSVPWIACIDYFIQPLQRANVILVRCNIGATQWASPFPVCNKMERTVFACSKLSHSQRCLSRWTIQFCTSNMSLEIKFEPWHFFGAPLWRCWWCEWYQKVISIVNLKHREYENNIQTVILITKSNRDCQYQAIWNDSNKNSARLILPYSNIVDTTYTITILYVIYSETYKICGIELCILMGLTSEHTLLWSNALAHVIVLCYARRTSRTCIVEGIRISFEVGL